MLCYPKGSLVFLANHAVCEDRIWRCRTSGKEMQYRKVFQQVEGAIPGRYKSKEVTYVFCPQHSNQTDIPNSGTKIRESELAPMGQMPRPAA